MSLLGGIMAGVGLIGGIGARNKAARTQDAAIQKWYDYQNKAKAAADTAIDANRETNYGTLTGLYPGATLEGRQDVINTEADRLYQGSLAEDFTGPGTTSFEARKLAEATQEARDMIRAQAFTRAHGNSFGGMTSRRNLDMGAAARDIGRTNENSMLDLGVLAKKQAVQPVMYQYNSTGLGEMLTGFGANMLGGSLAGMIGGNPPPVMSAWTPNSGGIGLGAMPPVGYVFNDDYRYPGYGKM